MEFTAITSRQNATLKHLARLAREKKYRLKTGEMVCEGEKMLGEALDSAIRVGAVLVRAQGPRMTRPCWHALRHRAHPS